MRTERGASPARGFALVLCLWTVVVVLLLAAALDRYVQARLAAAQSVRERVQDELDLYSTRSTVLYLVATRQLTRAGLRTGAPSGTGTAADDRAATLRLDPAGDEIALDGSVYRGLGRARFALQDESGLLALNADAQGMLTEVLASCGADPGEIGGLLARLADYRDGNDLSRTNGAETADYAAAGLEPPANQALRAAPELALVLGWGDWLAAHPQFRVHDWLSTATRETFNPNSAPRALLARLAGIGPEHAAAIVAERRRAPFRSAADFELRTGLALERGDDAYRFHATERRLQLRLWRAGATQATRLALESTPPDPAGPWRIHSVYRARRAPQGQLHEVPGSIFAARAPAAP